MLCKCFLSFQSCGKRLTDFIHHILRKGEETMHRCVVGGREANKLTVPLGRGRDEKYDRRVLWFLFRILIVTDLY